jgi:hypothetical protein
LFGGIFLCESLILVVRRDLVFRDLRFLAANSLKPFDARFVFLDLDELLQIRRAAYYF